MQMRPDQRVPYPLQLHPHRRQKIFDSPRKQSGKPLSHILRRNHHEILISLRWLALSAYGFDCTLYDLLLSLTLENY